MKEQSPTVAIGGASAGRFGKTARPLRILVVGPSLDILGGQAVQAARLISRLRQLSFFEVGFLAINPRLPGGLRRLQAIKYLRTVVTSLLYVATLLARVPKYDVIHVFSASYLSFVIAPTPAILIAKLFGKKILLNYHSGEAEDHLTRWRSALATIRLVDEVAVPSQYLARVFARFGITAHAINNLIELGEFTYRARTPLRPVFLSNRNLEPHYGVDHLLRAFAAIQTRLTNAELVVAGDGSQRASLEALALELGLRNTKFVGRVEQDEITARYQSADIYLNGSEIDNQPLSILEAFACGLPVVTTDAGGIPDMVADGETGFVVSRGDHQAIARRALTLLEKPDLAKSITENGLEECEKYSWRAVRGQWTDLYHGLMNQRSQKRGHPDTRIAKLRRMSVTELRVRVSQRFAAFAERQGISSLAKLPSNRALLSLLRQDYQREKEHTSADELVAHFRKETPGVFFSSFSNPDAVLAELRMRWPQREQQILEQADCIIAGRFNLLGFRNLSFGDPIDWHVEPVSGKSAPKQHWSRLDYLDPEIIGDKKIVWELNRHQYFVALGQAYWLSRDEKYAETFVTHLNSWMDRNPPKEGINWASSLEIAFRSISWLWALNFFRHSAALDPGTFARVMKFLYLNARHLQTYLSTYFSPNTHLTGEALGLFYLGTLLPAFKEAPAWRAMGRRILSEQLTQQVKADGVYFEQSSYYHRYTTDFYLHLLILSRHSATPAVADGFTETFNSEVEEKLKALLDHLMYITRPDGTSPLFGDDDGGRLMFLDHRPANDFRSALSNGAALFRRGDYKFVAGELAEETLWLLGPEGVREFDRIAAEEPASQSQGFPHGGYYVMRDGWHDRANYLLFDCGPHGANNCGHAHADALSIEVAAKGQPMLIDPGTHTYTGSKDLRDWFRGSSAHNVLTVDGEPSSIAAGPFSWRTIAQCEPLSWISERRFDYVEGRHDGYERLSNPAIYTRSILFLKNDYWLMRDSVASDGNHNLQLRFHFTVGADLRLEPLLNTNAKPEAAVARGENASLQVVAFGPNGSWSRKDGWLSQCYGDRVDAPVYQFSASTSAANRGPEELITLLLPAAGKSGPTHRVREVEAIGGRAFEITDEHHCDLVMMRDARGSRKVETVRLVSDFNWTWVRFSRKGSELSEELVEFLVLDGQRLELDGKEILRSAKEINYLMASRVGNQFRLQTNEGALDLSLPVCDLESLFAEVNRRARAS